MLACRAEKTDDEKQTARQSRQTITPRNRVFFAADSFFFIRFSGNCFSAHFFFSSFCCGQLIFKQARSFALRERGFFSISNSSGTIGFFVKISILFSAPQTHSGRRGGQKHFPESF